MSQKTINRIVWSVFAILIAYFLLVVWVVVKPVEVMQRKSVSKLFLNHVVAERYGEAFDLMYDREVAGTGTKDSRAYEAAREEWVTNIRKMKENGSAIVSYRDLKVSVDDMAVISRVFLTISNNGRETEHFTQVQQYIKNNGKYGIADLQIMPRDGGGNEWQYMFRSPNR